VPAALSSATPYSASSTRSLFSSAAFVKLNDPLMTVSLSITITLLCAIACAASMRVGKPVEADACADTYAVTAVP